MFTRIFTFQTIGPLCPSFYLTFNAHKHACIFGHWQTGRMEKLILGCGCVMVYQTYICCHQCYHTALFECHRNHHNYLSDILKFKTKFISLEIPSKHFPLKVHPRLKPSTIGFPSRDEKDTNDVDDCAILASKYFIFTDASSELEIQISIQISMKI